MSLYSPHQGIKFNPVNGNLSSPLGEVFTTRVEPPLRETHILQTLILQTRINYGGWPPTPLDVYRWALI